MEPPLTLDDNCDFDLKYMKGQLTEYGLYEDNLSRQEMSDLLKALMNSRKNIKDDEILENTVIETACNNNSPKERMKRRYLNVRDRRLPWSLFSKTLTQAEKAQTLAVYIKLMSINNYRQARQSSLYTTWPPPIQIVEKSVRTQPTRLTRSGRSMPVYEDFDDDSSDLDFVVTQSKKKKGTNCDENSKDGLYSNKVLSLKRKPSKDNNIRPVKVAKVIENNNLGNNTDCETDYEVGSVIIEDQIIP